MYARCKNNFVWTNDVRGSLSDDELTKLDSRDTDGTQFRGIKVSDHCDVFASSSKTFCAVGCQPIPEDYATYWSVNYNGNSPNADINGAPIKTNTDTDIRVSTISCRSGYATVVGSSTVDKVTCGSDGGWTPANLNTLITCKPGCSMLNIANGAVTVAYQNVTGAAPYNVGDLVGIQCGDGYVVSGSTSTVTCTALQRWKPSTLPVCVTSSSVADSTTSSAGLPLLELLLMGLVVVLQI
eukprot:sb/3469124/